MRLGAACMLTAAGIGFAVMQGVAAQPGTAAVAVDTSTGDMDPQAVATFRCTQLADPLACMSALSGKPHDPGLLVAEADALVSRGRPGEAIGVYRQALRTGADPQSTAARIADAESMRKSLLRECAAGADASAVSACEAAWLPGAPDEVALFKRRGRLLRGADRSAEALQAYVVAARLAPRDRNAARAVVELSASSASADPVILIARAEALLTLGHPADALAPLRQALEAAPDRIDLKHRLQMAERGAALAALPRVPAHQRPALEPPAPQSSAAAKSAGAALTRLAPPGNEAPLTRSN